MSPRMVCLCCRLKNSYVILIFEFRSYYTIACAYLKAGMDANALITEIVYDDQFDGHSRPDIVNK